MRRFGAIGAVGRRRGVTIGVVFGRFRCALRWWFFLWNVKHATLSSRGGSLQSAGQEAVAQYCDFEKYSVLLFQASTWLKAVS